MHRLAPPYLLLKSVELDDSRIPLQDLHFVPFGRSAPLRATNIALVESKGVAAARRLPAEAVLGEPALAIFPRQVEVDVVETLTVAASARIRGRVMRRKV